MRDNYLIIGFIIPIVISGCTPTLSITYKSEPSSATLFQNNQNFGYTPVTLYYQVTPEEIRRGYKIVEEINVRWASGATAFREKQKIYLSQGYNQEFTFLRPSEIPGIETDVNFTLEIKRTELQQKIIQDAEEARMMARLAQSFRQQQLEQQELERQQTDRQRQLQQQQLTQAISELNWNIRQF